MSQINVNEIKLIGTTVANSEVRTTPSGKQVGEARIAVNKRVFDKNTQQWKDANTNYFTVISWSDPTFFSDIRKGTRLFVIGEFNLREYTRKDNTKGYSAEINAQHVYRAPRDTSSGYKETTTTSINDGETISTGSGEYFGPKFRDEDFPSSAAF